MLLVEDEEIGDDGGRYGNTGSQCWMISTGNNTYINFFSLVMIR